MKKHHSQYLFPATVIKHLEKRYDPYEIVHLLMSLLDLLMIF